MWKLGDSAYYKQKVEYKLKDLYNEIPEDVDFVTINGKKKTSNTVFIVDKDDLLINTVQEYEEAYKKYGMIIGSFKKIHTGLSITIPNYFRELLDANGLFNPFVISTKNIAGVTFNTQDLGLSLDICKCKIWLSC